MSSPDAILQLMNEATHYLQRGQPEQAAACWARVIAMSPGHAGALNSLGNHALQHGRLDEAQLLLEQAAAVAPDIAIIHANLARVHVSRGDTEAALRALDHAIGADPTAWGAHFEKARLLEELDRSRAASTSWSNGLQHMPDSMHQNPQLRPVIEQAQTKVMAAKSELAEYLAKQLKDLHSEKHHREFERVQHTLDILAGRRNFVTARPLMLPVPRLPAIPFFHRRDYPWTEELEASFPDILAELHALLDEEASFTPYVQTRHGEPAGQFAALDRKLDWGAFFLWRDGKRIPENADRCPATETALAKAPQFKVQARAPVAFFSALKPGTHIPPHNGATNARLTVHLPLIVPPECGLRVGDEVHTWKPGELVLFDDTIRHEAWNRSNALRVVLIFDIWHPMLSLLERESFARIIEGMRDFYGEDADLGEL